MKLIRGNSLTNIKKNSWETFISLSSLDVHKTAPLKEC
jgi:hypothetical protein